MKRKTLKQKLRSQVRKTNELRKQEHEQAGITINFELAAMQSVGMAHGIMATMIHAKNLLGENDSKYHEIRDTAQERIAQCVVALVGMGIPADVVNQRILQGH